MVAVISQWDLPRTFSSLSRFGFGQTLKPLDNMYKQTTLRSINGRIKYLLKRRWGTFISTNTNVYYRGQEWAQLQNRFVSYINALRRSFSVLQDFSYYGGAESLDEGRSPRRTAIVSPTTKDDGKHHPGPPQDPSDFLWLMTEEPHRTRRMAIMKAHPEVTHQPFPTCYAITPTFI